MKKVLFAVMIVAYAILAFTPPAFATEPRPQVDLTEEFKSVEYNVEYGMTEAVIIVRAKQAPTILAEASNGAPECKILRMRKSGPNFFILVGLYGTDDGDGCTFHLTQQDDGQTADVTINTVGS
jgi:hypothetical protein